MLIQKQLHNIQYDSNNKLTIVYFLKKILNGFWNIWLLFIGEVLEGVSSISRTWSDWLPVSVASNSSFSSWTAFLGVSSLDSDLTDFSLDSTFFAK